MKIKEKTKPIQMKKFFIQSLLVVICMLTGYISSAQQVTSVDARSNPKDQVNVYLEKNKDTPLVRQFNSNPNDPIAAHALKLAIVLDNPKNHENFKPEMLDKMKSDLKGLMEEVNYIDNLVKQGTTYEKASEINARRKAAAKTGDEVPAEGSKTAPAQQDAPTLSVPNQ